MVAGPAGCGKSECVKTFALAEKERGKILDVQTIFTKSMESRELLGHVNPANKCVFYLPHFSFYDSFCKNKLFLREWKEGLLPGLLRRFCLQRAEENFDFTAKPVMKIIQLDGEVSNLHIPPSITCT